MTERIIDKLDRLGAEAEIKEMTPEIRRFALLVRQDVVAGWPMEPAQPLPFGVGGGLVAIKTLLSRDPCVHANTAIQMIDAILAEQPTLPDAIGPNEDELPAYAAGWNDCRALMLEMRKP